MGRSKRAGYDSPGSGSHHRITSVPKRTRTTQTERNGLELEAQPETTKASGRKIKLTSQDQKFLRALKIAIDDDAARAFSTVRVLSPGLLLAWLRASSAYAAETVEILRDQFRNPTHFLHAPPPEAAYGAGYAQAEDRKDALPAKSPFSRATEQPALSAGMQSIVEAFAAGVNRFLLETP